MCTVAIAGWVKAAVDEWLAVACIEDGLIFRCLTHSGTYPPTWGLAAIENSPALPRLRISFTCSGQRWLPALVYPGFWGTNQAHLCLYSSNLLGPALSHKSFQVPPDRSFHRCLRDEQVLIFPVFSQLNDLVHCCRAASQFLHDLVDAKCLLIADGCRSSF